VLERQGYSVVEAENGYEGLQYYGAEPTDLVITDMQMPVMDGLQMIMELRRTFPTAKIIAISGGQRALAMVKTLT
jgi:YesN/AraC family two-component response regulator